MRLPLTRSYILTSTKNCSLEKEFKQCHSHIFSKLDLGVIFDFISTLFCMVVLLQIKIGYRVEDTHPIVWVQTRVVWIIGLWINLLVIVRLQFGTIYAMQEKLLIRLRWINLADCGCNDCGCNVIFSFPQNHCRVRGCSRGIPKEKELFVGA